MFIFPKNLLYFYIDIIILIVSGVGTLFVYKAYYLLKAKSLRWLLVAAVYMTVLRLLKAIDSFTLIDLYYQWFHFLSYSLLCMGYWSLYRVIRDGISNGKIKNEQ